MSYLYNILVHVYNYSQLKRINATGLENLEEKFTTLADDLGITPQKQGFGFYNYILNDSFNEAAYYCLEAINFFAELIKESELSWLNYNLFLLKSDEKLDTEACFKLLHMTNTDNSLWLTKDQINDFNKEWLEYEVYSGFYRITKFKPQVNIINHLQKQYLKQSQLKSIINQTLTSFQYGNYVILNYTGPAGYGKHYSLEQYLKNLKLPAHLEYLWLDPYSLKHGPFECFKNALSDLFLEYLTVHDLIDQAFKNRLAGIIDALKNPYKSSFLADSLSKDLQILYTIYLRFYAAELRKSDLAPFITIENIEGFSMATQELLFSIFEICKQENILIVTLNKIAYNKLFTIDVRNYEATPTEARLAATMNLLVIDPKRLERANPYALMLSQYLKSKFQTETYTDLSLSTTLRWLLKNVNETIWRILYMVALCDGMIPINDLFKKIVSKKSELLTYTKHLQNLIDLRLIYNPNFPHLSFTEIVPLLEELLQDEVAEIKLTVAKGVFELSSEGHYINLAYLFLLLEDAELIDEALLVFFNLTSGVLNRRRYDEFTTFLQRKFFSKANLTPSQAQNFHIIYEQATLRKNLLLAVENQEPFEYTPNDEIKIALEQNIYTSFYQLEQYRYLKAKNHIDPSNSQIKKLLISFQKLNNIYGEALANNEMASYFLSVGEFRQAFDYCEIAIALSDQANFQYSMLACLGIECASALAYGNFSLAYKSAEKGLVIAENVAIREKELFFRFIKARVLYECGQYAETLKLLEQALQIARLYNFTYAIAVLNSWKGRCFAYLENFDEALGLLTENDNRETLLYLAETYYLMNNLELAFAAIKQAKELKKARFLFNITEKENWGNGYNSLENRLLCFYSEKDLLEQLIEAFYYFISGLLGNTKEATLGLRKLYNFNKINPDEPYCYLYPFYYSQLLIKQDEKEERYLGQSRAARLLSVRGTRFDNLKMQDNFAHKNYWHKKINQFFKKQS